MTNKCAFCGGDNDRYNSKEYRSDLCEVCYNCVSGNLCREDETRPTNKETLIEYIVCFKDRLVSYNLTNHPNVRKAYEAHLKYKTEEDYFFEDDIKQFKRVVKDLESLLESFIVNLTNENSKLKEELNAQDMYREGLARCTLENKRLTEELAKMKQERNDWEKLAGEYRFKAEKLAEENKKLDKEITNLIDENADLAQENRDLKFPFTTLYGLKLSYPSTKHYINGNYFNI